MTMWHHEVFRNSTPTRQAGALLTPGGHLIGLLTVVTLELAKSDDKSHHLSSLSCHPSLGLCLIIRLSRSLSQVFIQIGQNSCVKTRTHICVAIFVGSLFYLSSLNQT